MFVAAERKPNSVPIGSIFHRSTGASFLCDANCSAPQGTFEQENLHRLATYPRSTDFSPRARALRCLVLLPVGFAMPLMSPPTRCALTAPFHPCVEEMQKSECRMQNRRKDDHRDLSLRSAFCIHRSAFPPRFLSVALSVGLLRLDVIKHRALCSSDFPHHGLPRSAIALSAAIETSVPHPGVGKKLNSDARNNDHPLIC